MSAFQTAPRAELRGHTGRQREAQQTIVAFRARTG
jgi:hypothetical protein